MKLVTKWSRMTTLFLIAFILMLIGLIYPDSRIATLIIVAALPTGFRLIGYPIFEVQDTDNK
jgi:hypothetical protein